MKLKKASLIVLVFGFLVTIVGLVVPVICMQPSGATGIIGGADAPTYAYLLFALYDGLLFVLALFGFALILTSVFCLIFQKTVNTHCHISTSSIALALSGVGGLGLVCALVWFSIIAFGNISKYPIEYPASLLVGMISLIAFIGLIALYFKVRKKHWSIKGIVIDVLTSVVYLPTFFFAISWLYAIVA